MKIRSGGSVLVLCLMFLFGVIGNVTTGSAQEVRAFTELKQKYLTLRNTDVQVEQLAEWRRLANRFESFAKTNKGGTGPHSLLHASILYAEIFDKHGLLADFEKAVNLLSLLVRQYPKSEFADDALVREGELYQRRGATAKAKRAFQRVVDEYPTGDMFDVARVRLERIAQRGAGQGDQAVRQIAGNPAWPLIVLDPGHGGEDVGAPGQGGLLEKDVVLAVALELERLLRATKGVRVAVTRTSDTFVPLATRTQLANDAEAALFVSLHANSSPGARAAGFEVFYLDNTGDQASQKLAERENASVSFEGADGDLYFMLSDLIQSGKLDESVVLANVVTDGLYGYLKPKWPHVKRLSVKKAPFYVLVGAHMPCALVEMFFIDNKTDGTFLARKDFRDDLAKGLHQALLAYLKREGKL